MSCKRLFARIKLLLCSMFSLDSLTTEDLRIVSYCFKICKCTEIRILPAFSFQFWRGDFKVEINLNHPWITGLD